MRLNDIRPARGAKRGRRRVGRGTGSGLGKTAGRGHKGQKSRSGGYHKVGFEGGQMPLQRRLPKRGFRSRRGRYSAEVRLQAIDRLKEDVVDLEVLKRHDLVPRVARRVKVILSGELTRPVTLKGLVPTRGARAALEKAGGKVED